MAAGDYTDDLARLDALLSSVGLRSTDDTPKTVFSQLVDRLKRLFRVKALENTTTFSQEGMPVLTQRIEFGGGQAGTEEQVERLVRHDDALRSLQKVLADFGITVWMAVDRLDEAFQGRPALERPALRALFRTYLDLLEFENIRLKLFVRRDLFARVVEGGFVNLTHINARRVDITWDEDDLYDLLYRRLRESKGFVESLGLVQTDADLIFGILFPDQVDQGDRKPKTWAWMMARIRDGNGVIPPRNLIDLVLKVVDNQMRREEREPQEYEPGRALVMSDALKRGLDALSAERVQDTLLAEAGDQAYLIEHFRGGKAEHSGQSLRDMLGERCEDQVQFLKTIGFLEPVGQNYKVPMLYRNGLNITQGKAAAAD